MSELDAEREFLKMLLKLCHTTRDPRNRRSRPEMVIVSSRWEMQFQKRLEEIEAAGAAAKALQSPEPVAA